MDDNQIICPECLEFSSEEELDEYYGLCKDCAEDAEQHHRTVSGNLYDYTCSRNNKTGKVPG